MSLDKAIKSGKEKRKSYEYDFAKQVDAHCRNHGSCPWCYRKRMHKNLKRLAAAESKEMEN